MNDPHESVDQKVKAIFRELVGDRVARLDGSMIAEPALCAGLPTTAFNILASHNARDSRWFGRWFDQFLARMPSMDAAGTAELVAALPLAEAALRVLQRVTEAEPLNQLFDEHRGRGYERLLTFPQMVRLIGDALLEAGGSGHRVFARAAEAGELPASMAAVYGKLGRLNIGLSQAFLAERSDPLRDLFPAEARRTTPPSLRSFATIILDGKAIKRVAKRLKPLRGVAGGLLGGRTLVALEYASGLAIAFHAEADGDANDARFVPHLFPVVRSRITGPRLWLADRGFADLQRFAEFTQESDHFLVRYHSKCGFHLPMQHDVSVIHATHRAARFWKSGAGSARRTTRDDARFDA